MQLLIMVVLCCSLNTPSFFPIQVGHPSRPDDLEQANTSNPTVRCLLPNLLRNSIHYLFSMQLLRSPPSQSNVFLYLPHSTSHTPPPTLNLTNAPYTLHPQIWGHRLRQSRNVRRADETRLCMQAPLRGLRQRNRASARVD